MHVLILGGTGFVGRYLQGYLENREYTVTPLGREAFSAEFDLVSQLNHADIVVMLAGANIAKRWTPSYKKTIWDSRIKTNQRLKMALSVCDQPPERIFSASAVGIYPQATCDQPHDESTEEVALDELGQLGERWEEASRDLTPTPTILRFGVVLGENGGALQQMIPPFNMGLGGPVAGGEQCFSWIHQKDLARALVFLIENPQIPSPVNLTAPAPVTNRVFGKTLASCLKRPFGWPLPEWALKILFGAGAQVLTHSSAVIPKRLLQAGFQFHYPTHEKALGDLVTKTSTHKTRKNSH